MGARRRLGSRRRSGPGEGRKKGARLTPPAAEPARQGWAPFESGVGVGGGGGGLAPLALMATSFFALSFLLHFPGMSPSNYSDIMDTFWQRIVNSGGIIPYVSYKLEYPALSAVALYVSSIWRNMYAFYVSMALILLASMLLALVLAYSVLRARGMPAQRIAYFMIFTPSFLYYSIYSFDWIGAGLMMASLYFAYRRRAVVSGAFIGLATAARIIPILCLPFLLYEFKSNTKRVKLLVAAGEAWLAVNAYFIVTNWQGFLYPYIFQASYNVEDSWLGLLVPYEKPVSAMMLVGLLALILHYRRRFDLFQQSLLALLAFMLTSYKFPPQYMIMLLPLFAVTATSYTEFMAANVLNVMVILFYFTSAFNAGGALALTSPVQWVAIARQAILALVFVRVMLAGKKPLPMQEEPVALEVRVPSAGGIRGRGTRASSQ